MDRSFVDKETRQGARQPDARRREEGVRGRLSRVLFHPDYTVGPGIAPDLLTLTGGADKALAG